MLLLLVSWTGQAAYSTRELWLAALVGKAVLAVELAVRAEVARFGYAAQSYTRWDEAFWWETFGVEARAFGKGSRRHGRMCHWWLFQPAAGLSGNLYWNGEAWGFGVGRWWRLADALRRRRYFWAGSDVDLERCLELGTRALRAEGFRLQEWVRGYRVVDRLGAAGERSVRLGKENFQTIEDALVSVGFSGELGSHFLAPLPPEIPAPRTTSQAPRRRAG